MDYFRLIFYQSLILFVSSGLGQCERVKYDLDSVLIENTGKEWTSLSLSKHENSDEYTFNNSQLNEICGGALSSSNIEITEVFDTKLTFSLIPNTKNQLFTIKVTFSAKSSVEQFFRDIHSQQEQACSENTYVGKLVKCEINTNPKEDPVIGLFEAPVEVYHKYLNAIWFPNMRTVNFVYHKISPESYGVILSLVSKTFNISDRFATNKHILCPANITTPKFILHFPQGLHADRFYDFIENDLNYEIPCPTKGVISYKLIRRINLL